MTLNNMTMFTCSLNLLNVGRDLFTVRPATMYFIWPHFNARSHILIPWNKIEVPNFDVCCNVLMFVVTVE